MRKLLLVMLVVGLNVAVPSRAAEVLRIAVSPFVDHSGGRTSTTWTSDVAASGGSQSGQSFTSKGNIGGQVADAVITELVKLGRYEIIERIQLEKVIAEQKLQATEMDAVSQASEAARILGADLLVTGSITEAASAQTGKGYVIVKKKELLGRVVVDSRLIEIATTRALWGTTTEGVETLQSKKIMGLGKDDLAGVDLLLGKAAREAANTLVKELVPVLDRITGSVERDAVVKTDAVLRGTKLFLGAGSKVGVHVGDRFDIFVLGEPFQLGEKMIREEVQVGTIVVGVVQPDYATGDAPEVVLGMTKASLEGMTARRSEKAIR